MSSRNTTLIQQPTNTTATGAAGLIYRSTCTLANSRWYPDNAINISYVGVPVTMTESFLRAVQRGDLERIRRGVAESADLLYCSNRHGDTPLLVAARHGHVTILKFLADERNVSLSQSNVDGKTALHEAACSEQLEAVEFLCKRNVNVDCLKRADW